MGFDLTGLKAKSKKGEYFRANVWFWRPLANYVLDVCKVPERMRTSWYYNDGHIVPESDALRIADILDEQIKEGKVKAYEKLYEKARKALREDDPQGWYPFSAKLVSEFATFCRESGGFEIY
jgi:hypothetical protein